MRLSIEVAAAAAIAALCIWLGSILESGQGSRLRGQLAELQRQNAELRGQQGSVEELQARVTELQIENSALRQSGPLQTTIALNDAGGRIELDKQGGISGISMSSPHEEETLKAALTAGHITTPAFLKELRGESGTLMGASNDASGLLSPVGTVVLSTRPKFRWRSLSGAGSYTVSIYDSEHREVTSSQPLAVSQWTSASTLERGKIYTWQVRTVKDGQELVMPPQSAPEARFKVIEQGKAAEAEHARKTYRGSHLMLGLAYAEIGLLDEAEGEFNALVAANPKSAVARKLLQNVRALRRSV